jgi:hypothetical protein
MLASTTASAQDATAKTCTADQGPDRAMCVVLLGATRQILHDGNAVAGHRACSPVDPHDLSDTYRVMHWIRAHPERQGDDLQELAATLLEQAYPCPN